MCVASVVLKGKIMPEEAIENCWAGNSDGGGYAYVHEGKVRIVKGLMDYDQFKRSYLGAAERYSATSPFLVHFRYATHGGVRRELTHPFRIEGGGALIHNGVMSGYDDCDVGESDTSLFAAEFGHMLKRDNIYIVKKDLEKALGWNKLAILYPDMTFAILNQERGHWYQGCWYSNSDYTHTPRFGSCLTGL